MVKLIVGSRGTGKTKRLIEQVQRAAQESKGNVVCIEHGDALRFDLSYHIRLIDITEYGVCGGLAYYGFIAGLLAGNYDITNIFGDATLRIISGKGKKDMEALADFVERLNAFTEQSSVGVTLTVSCDESELPERIRVFVQ